jgi:4-hydroxyacetophenone monooxygenase
MTQRVHPAGLPITDDDARIAAALEDVSIPTLMMSMVHMSGDASILRGPIRPAGIFLNEVQGFMSEEDKAAVRAQALELIKDYRDGGCRLPPPPSPETIHEMMRFMVASDVPAEYVPMMLEEMELDGEDVREVHWDRAVSEEVKQAFHVVVIGCGMSGLLAAIRLEEAGIPCTVIEKNPAVGGTWYENRYPGCRVDVGNHFYCYSFEPNPDWSEFFAQRGELQAYFETCLEKYGIRDRVRFGTEVLGARYGEDTHRWAVRIRGADGSEETLEANAIISAVGQLNRPKLPEIRGMESFRGPSMHSAQWQPEHELRGKRVAVIGTGASAFQIVPTIAEQVEKLVVFQRSAPWMFSNPNYHRKVGEGKKWALRHLPYYARWYRFLLFWPGCDGGLEAMRIDPDWPHQERSTSAMNEAARVTFTQYLEEQVGDDEELLAKVVPDYVCLGKRVLQDNGSWLAALKRSNVELVTDPIAEIREDSVVCQAPGAVGRRPDGLPGDHGARFSEPVLHLRPGHQPGPRGKPDLPLGVPGPVHHGLPEAAAAGWPVGDGVPAAGARRIQPTAPEGAGGDGLVAPYGHPQLVQEPGGPGHRPVAVAARRLLALDPESRSAGLPAQLSAGPRRPRRTPTGDRGRCHAGPSSPLRRAGDLRDRRAA